MGDQSFFSKKALLVFGFNALVVVLCLFLSYRILSPKYERKESISLSKLGIFHTQLAAERLGARLGNLREELKDNGMRLVDPARGPITLDPSRWLWLRIQDRDWRAPNFLEPMPAPHSDVDTWQLNTNKNYFVLTERVPILKEGVRDFVVVEGGLKPIVLQDLQSDPNFGVWVFDLEAYKKGGLSVAKIYEKPSSEGSLTKDDMKLLTSDVLGQVFQGQEEVTLPGKAPWALYFKNSSGPARLGILGYWAPQATPVDLSGTWISLAVALMVLSLFASFLIIKFSASAPTEEDNFAPPNPHPTFKSGTILHAQTAALVEGPGAKAPADLSYEGVLAWVHKIIDQLKEPLANIQDRIEVASGALKKQSDNSSGLAADSLEFARQETLKSRSLIDQISSLSGKSVSEFESTDVELFYREFASLHPEAQSIETFFDPDLWRVKTDAYDLTLLFRIYIQFLQKRETEDGKLHISARYFAEDHEDVGALEVKRSGQFKTPFVRVTFHLPTKTPLGRTELQEFFELTHSVGGTATSVELPLSLKVVDRLGGRLKIKSNFEDGNLLTLDIPALETRRPEDKINAKQMKSDPLPDTTRVEKVSPPITVRLEEKILAELNSETVPEPAAPVPTEKSFKTESTDSGMRILRLSEIEKAKSFAENISDERSRVRSRFRIRKPGEKE